MVVLDLIMPELDGMGLLAKMRGGAASTRRLIVQTSHGSIETVVAGDAQRGALGFVVKPVRAPSGCRVSLANCAAGSYQLED